jgi:adenosylhomocysteine nucleosidase
MPAKLAIIAALPREVAALVRGVEPHRTFEERGIMLYQLPNAVIVAGGMGGLRATLAFEAARAVAHIEHVISTGLAGACTSGLRGGDLAEAAFVVEERTGERYSVITSPDPHVLVSSIAIADIKEKNRLAETYGAAMVDMEAATIARLAAAHGVTFRAIKAISDGHEFEMPSLKLFADHNGHFRTGAFAMHTALRPQQWGKAIELGQASRHALAKLHVALRTIMAESAS